MTLQDKPGVYFFSLDAYNRFAVETARSVFHLPYFYAYIQVEHRPNDTIYYQCSRKDKRAQQGEFTGEYRPSSEIPLKTPGSLAYWLTERYCLYCTDRHGNVYRGEIDHDPWPIQSAEASHPYEYPYQLIWNCPSRNSSTLAFRQKNKCKILVSRKAESKRQIARPLLAN